MPRAELRAWLDLPRRLRAAPALASRVTENLWLVILSTEDTAAQQVWAVILFGLDGIARHVPGDHGDKLWRDARRAPCRVCFRDPHRADCPAVTKGGDA